MSNKYLDCHILPLFIAYEYRSHKFCQHFENLTCYCILYSCIGVQFLVNILKMGPATPSFMYKYRSHKFCQQFENEPCYCIFGDGETTFENLDRKSASKKSTVEIKKCVAQSAHACWRMATLLQESV